MMWMQLTLSGMVLAHSLGAPGIAPGKVTTLEALRDRHRVLLIFAPFAGDVQLKAQEAEICDHAQEARERDLVVVEATSGRGLESQGTESQGTESQGSDGQGSVVDAMRLADPESARKQYGVSIGAFTVVLIGKDGGEKLRSKSPLTMQRLQTTIDAMPMRQDEMRKKAVSSGKIQGEMD